MSRYAKLTSFLQALGVSSRRVGFAEIERVLGFRLPASARTYSAWWSNNAVDGRQSNAWLSAGWQTEELDLPGEKITFRRSKVIPKRGKAAKPKSQLTRPATAGVPKNLPDAAGGTVDVAITMHWKQLGVIAAEQYGKLSFPPALAVPALYRFRLSGAQATRHYIGEAVNLRRRFGNYRNPGPSQETSNRLNKVLTNHLAAGGTVEVDLITADITLSIDGRSANFDLVDKATRRLLEQAAVVANAALDIESLNR